MSVEVKAQNSLSMTSIKAIKDASDEANTLLDGMRQSAVEAGTTLNGIYADAEEAMASATSAQNSANTAQYALSEIEQVVDAVNWISQHGTYVLTQDTEPIQGKYYFEYDNGAYISVTPSEGDDPHALSLYELDSLDASISNYVASHIMLDNNGLVIQTDNINSKVRISGEGVKLTNENGKVIATFSEAVTLGDANGIHIKLSAVNGLEFWNGAETDASNRVAYINSETLKITKAEIETTLRIGQFVWKVQDANRVSLVYVP